MMKSLFIVDGSLDRPLLHSQGIPLLKRLSQKGIRCSVQSFEIDARIPQGELGGTLAEHNISWYPVVIPAGLSGKQRIQMIWEGFWKAYQICRRGAMDIVHCRSYRPAVVGSLLKQALNCGFLFDMRGFLIDELVADGRWRRGTLKYLIAKKIERWCILQADGLITTSPQFRQAVLELDYFPGRQRGNRVMTIPNCVDLQRFVFDPAARARLRSLHGWNDRLVMVFAGDARRYFETMSYIFAFFQAMQGLTASAFLLLLIYGEGENVAYIHEQAVTAGLQDTDFQLLTVSPTEMPAYLSAADIGLAFFKCENFSNAIASPIKFAEYLSCGLPVVINPSVGDTGRIVHQYRVGVVINPEDKVQLQQGAIKIHEMAEDDPILRQRCRLAAEKELSLDYAVELYFQAYQMVVEVRAKRKDRWQPH